RDQAGELTRPVVASLSPSSFIRRERVDVLEELFGVAGAHRDAVDGGGDEAEVAALTALEAVLHHDRVLALAERIEERDHARPQPLDGLLAQLDLHGGVRSLHEHRGRAGSDSTR